MSAQGEDRSDFQPVSGWSGLDFGFVKATEGTGWTGQTFPANWANLKAAGIPRGAYHFLHPSENIAAQVDHFVGVVKAQGLEQEDMLVVDTEILSGLRTHTQYVFEDELALVDAATKQFLDGVKSHVNPAHHPIIIYTDHFVGQYLSQTAQAYPLLWFAWPATTVPDPTMYAPWHAWKFWQYSWSPVDKDAYNGSDADLAKWIKGYNTVVRPVVVVTTDGKESLLEICTRYNDKPSGIVARTLAHGLHPRLLAYLAEHPHHTAPMPKGMHLWVAEGKAA